MEHARVASAKITLRDWLKDASQKLPYQECVYIAHALFEQDVLNLDANLGEIALKALDAVWKMRILGMPLAKIMQKKHFYNHCFITTEDTLDPRPETEALIDAITIKPRSVLELGVGTGCLILSTMKKFPKATGLGVDISEAALKIANENAQILQIRKFTAKCNDWADEISGHFDLVLSNPPYVSKTMNLSQETMRDPEIALFGDADVYRKIFESIQNITFMEAIFEIPNYLIDEVSLLLKKFGYINYSFQEIFDSQIYVLKFYMQ